MVNNLVVVSDLHCGCRMGLCPKRVSLDDGGDYVPSKLQRKLLRWWEEFWGEWVPSVTKGEPFAVVCNGDAIDGVHHGSVTQISHNLADQAEIAYQLLAPVVKRCEGRYYHIRGTEAHVGKSGQEEERLAMRLGAVPNDEGQYARWELWCRVGTGLVHLSHHVGTAGSMAYESSALMRELSEAYVEAGRWQQEPPDVVVRSHRHRNAEVRVRTAKGFATVCTTPAWQLKTPFTYRIAGARQAQPQIGGTVIRCGDEEVFTRHQVWSLSRPKEVTP
jgi:hypothetical protein